MIAAAETFDGTWPFKARYSTRAGFAQHYVDEGPADGMGQGRDDGPVVLVHGEPTWGYLWRHLITSLARYYRVIVPDHMGFGKSADPAGRSYLAAEHIANLTSLLAGELDLRDITLVLHDWGGPIGTGFALRQPERIRRIVAVNTVLPLGLPGQDQAQAANLEASAWFRWARQAAADGSLEEVLGNDGHTVAHLMLTPQTITRPQVITPAWLRAYSAQAGGSPPAPPNS